ALVLQETGKLMELVDPKLESKFKEEEVMRMINIALACTNASPTLRPKMSLVVSMLEGRTPFRKFVSNPVSKPTDDLKFRAIKDYHEKSHDQSMIDHSESQSISLGTWSESSTSAVDLYPLIKDSGYWNDRE
ncbi:hypothetical protein MKW92_022186, partial [Papaver armeniacum]